MEDPIFQIASKEAFVSEALSTFQFQYERVEVYRKFVDYLGVSPKEVNSLEKIPFLPIEMFKTQVVLDAKAPADFYFESSGTTQMVRSKHYISDLTLYEASLEKSFEKFIGTPSDFIFLGLLPSYLEKQHSSLIYMVDHLMKCSNRKENGYYLYNHKELAQLLRELKDQKVILFGVSFALLDLIDSHPELSSESFENLIVIETGGMKGRKEEITKDELLLELKRGLGTQKIYSEYSMTELLSQAYSLGENKYLTPPWTRVLVRSLEDPLLLLPSGRNGAINIMDLANRHSCSFIATQDLGKLSEESSSQSIHHSFTVLGRIDHSDIRGCSLLVS